MHRSAAVAGALAAVLLPLASAQCFQDYECMYREPTAGAQYDLRPLCTPGKPYVHTDPVTNATYNFQICGTSNARCNPVPYPVEYHAGVAIQYFGDVPAPNSNCTDNTGAAVPCTRDCEVLGVGLPTITLADPNDPFGGVNVTHFSVPAAQNDPFQCAYDPSTGAPKERTVTVQVRCGRNLLVKPQVVSAAEVPPGSCNYLIVVNSFYGCGCEPYCGGRNCGSDGCFGYCGPQQGGGACPTGSQCNDDTGVCCAPDCRGRACGDDGCGNSCGDCAAGNVCNRYQQCVNPNAAPAAIPSSLPPVTVYTTTGGDKFAAFAGGAAATAVVGLAISYILRLRGA